MVKIDSLLNLHILISLNNKERTGYELMKELSNKLDKKISSSNIYPFLKELKENYYVNVRQLGRERIYSLTLTESRLF